MDGSYRDLRVWQRAMELVVRIYSETRGFPKSETYGLMSQMRRAAVSVPSNIAEGKGRQTDTDRCRFYSQGRGSLLELETQVVIAMRLGYISEPTAKTLIVETTDITKMLNALMESIRPRGRRIAA